MKSMRKQILYTSTKKLNGGALAVNYFIPEFPVGNLIYPLYIVSPYLSLQGRENLKFITFRNCLIRVSFKWHLWIV